MDPLAPPDLEKLIAANDVDGLVEVLGGWNLGSVLSAAKALGRVGDSRAVEPLVAALTRQTYVVGAGT
jgi:HEAT repeat protein